MVPPDESILAVQGVTAGIRGSGVDLDTPGLTPNPVRQVESGERTATATASTRGDGEMPAALAKLAPQGTKVAIEKDVESGKLVVRVKDAVTGDVIKQLPPEEVLRIARSIERYLGLLVDKRS